MFVLTVNKSSLRRLCVGALCCAVVAVSAVVGRYISTRTVTASASAVNKIESAQDIQTWFTGYGLDVDPASITADKVKIPRKWDDSFSAFNTVVTQSGLDLTKYKGKTVEKWLAEIPSQSSGDATCYGVLLVYKKRAVGAYLLEKPSGIVTGLQDVQATLAEEYAQTSGDEYSGDWGERHDAALSDADTAEDVGDAGDTVEIALTSDLGTGNLDTSNESAEVLSDQSILYTNVEPDAQGYPVE